MSGIVLIITHQPIRGYCGW